MAHAMAVTAICFGMSVLACVLGMGQFRNFRLHMLSEIEQRARQLFASAGAEDEATLEDMMSEWEQRFKLVQVCEGIVQVLCSDFESFL